jgi:PBP1b-binding outer membrane lipoprotein LpoB
MTYKPEIMKRIVFVAALALTMYSCAQHDTQSPDPAGNMPKETNGTVTLPTTADSIATDSIQPVQ